MTLQYSRLDCVERGVLCYCSAGFVAMGGVNFVYLSKFQLRIKYRGVGENRDALRHYNTVDLNGRKRSVGAFAPPGLSRWAG